MLRENFLVTLNLALRHQMPMGVKTGGSEKGGGKVQTPDVTEVETKAQRRFSEKPLPIPDLSDCICAMGLGL